MNDFGMTLELLSPLVPGAFLWLACIGSLARAVTGVAGGATRFALTQHFALRRNAADVAAKEGSQVKQARADAFIDTPPMQAAPAALLPTAVHGPPARPPAPPTSRLRRAPWPGQETAVTLVGMMLGMGLIRAAAGWQPAIWLAFCLLTALHVAANVRAMRALRIVSLNAARLELLLAHFLRTVRASAAARTRCMPALPARVGPSCARFRVCACC